MAISRKDTSMAGFFSKKQYAAIADKKLAIKLLNERCLECSDTVQKKESCVLEAEFDMTLLHLQL